jgi:hypothetical protein
VEIWSKWTSSRLTIDHLPRIAVHKTRWLRKYDTHDRVVVEVPLDTDERALRDPSLRLDRGCHFELVSLRVSDPERTWWSLGFEAFGDLDTVEDSLHRTVNHVAPAAELPSGALGLSYPAWLAEAIVCTS